ncbi:MAG: hypothetical protein KDE15_05475 [Erythrobacter sp.]|nr:hypothetical protein [Erythrobacter sp.]
MAAIRAACLTDHSLRRRLGECLTAQDAARVLGQPMEPLASLMAQFDAEAVEPGWPQPLFVLDQAPPADFLPAGMTIHADQLVIEWLWFGADALVDAYFYQSQHRMRGLPINLLLRCLTPITALEQFANAPAPDGLLLHLSRCGSTLTTRMLAADPGNVVVAEAPFLDHVVQLAGAGLLPEWMVHAAMAALLRFRDGSGKRGMVKLDAWHTLAMPLLQRVFPATPWCFLFRDPAEVLVSQHRSPGRHVQLGQLHLDAFGMTLPEGLDPAAYPAWMTECICRAALAARHDPHGCFVDYRALPAAVSDTILPHFGVHPDAATCAAMAGVAGVDAKAPDRAFTSDSQAKQAEAAGLVVPASLRAAHAALIAAAATPPGL